MPVESTRRGERCDCAPIPGSALGPALNEQGYYALVLIRTRDSKAHVEMSKAGASQAEAAPVGA